MRSRWGNCTMRPASSRTGVTSRTSAAANRRSSLGLSRANSVQEIDVLDGGQAIDLEIAQPPEMQALAHHGVQSAVKLRFLVPIPAGLVSEVLQGLRRAPWLTPAADTTMRWRGRGKATWLSIDWISCWVASGSLSLPRMADVKIHDDVVIRRDCRDHGKHGLCAPLGGCDMRHRRRTHERACLHRHILPRNNSARPPTTYSGSAAYKCGNTSR